MKWSVAAVLMLGGLVYCARMTAGSEGEGEVQDADYAVLSDVAGTGFWSPYGP